MAVCRHDGRLSVTNKPRRPASDVPERTACGHVGLTGSPDGSCALVWWADTSTRLSLHVSPLPVLRYRPRFNTDCVRVSVSACSTKLTGAEKGSVSTGRSAKTRLQHQKGRERCETVEKPKHRAHNKSSQSSFIYTNPSTEGEKQGREAKGELGAGRLFFQAEGRDGNAAVDVF